LRQQPNEKRPDRDILAPMNRAGEYPTQLELAPTLAALPGEPKAVIDRLASLGIRHVQLSATQPGLRPRELDGSARRDLAATLRRREMNLSGLDLWIPASHFADPAHVDRAVSAAVSSIDLAGDLGRCPLSMTLPEEEDSAATDAARALLEAAHRIGVPIADHHVPISNRDWNEFLGVGIDPAAWLAAGEEPAQAIHQNSEHLLSARLSDLMTTGMRGPIGSRDGRLDVMSYRVALAIADYRRPVILDVRQWPNPWNDLELAVDHWQRTTV
jgi:sugar phosphate isomerase/epimerase